MRNLLGWWLLLLAGLSLIPAVPRVWAYVQGHVDLTALDPGVYETVGPGSASVLVECSVPRQIVLKSGTPATGLYFHCTNNLAEDITLQWSALYDDTGGTTFLQIDGTQTSVLAAGSSGCQQLTLTPGSTRATRTVYFRGATGSDSPTYVAVNFSASVKVQNGNGGLGDSCP